MKAYTITDIGKVRSENQDCVRFVQNSRPAYGILALCDGMGGARAGSVASASALDAFIEKLSGLLNEKSKITALGAMATASAAHANTRVYDAAEKNDSYHGMGTTLVAAIIKGRECCVVNVGDSRAYHISNGQIAQITNDHSFVEDMVKRGTITREQAKNHPRKNIITRALGVDPTVTCDIFAPELKRGDLLLLCSDGLSNTLADDEILSISLKSKNLEEITRELLNLALSRGAPDNVTIGLLQK